jgi:very-short-patch-repair endonuclease
MSLPEVLLWRVLRSRPAGLKFRRQHPLGLYVLDFFCREAGLAIEIDGEAHDRGSRPQRDIARDDAVRLQGIRTVRIPAMDVLRDLEAVVRHIVQIASERTPLHHPAAPDGLPPRDKRGED